MKFYTYLICFCFPVVVIGQNFNAKVEAIINTNDSKNDLLEITGVAKNKTDITYSLRYELSVITTNDTKNSSKNAQSGYFTLEPFGTVKLSNTSVSIDRGTRTILLLLIYDEEDQPLGTARKVYEPSKATESNQNEENLSYKNENEGIQLYGMITENTKTKPGRDFYDFFYQNYHLSENLQNKIIQVDEMISFGRTTRIMVKIDNDIIFQFFSRPKLDYLKEMAKQALQKVNQYFERLERQKNQIIRY